MSKKVVASSAQRKFSLLERHLADCKGLLCVLCSCAGTKMYECPCTSFWSVVSLLHFQVCSRHDIHHNIPTIRYSLCHRGKRCKLRLFLLQRHLFSNVPVVPIKSILAHKFDTVAKEFLPFCNDLLQPDIDIKGLLEKGAVSPPTIMPRVAVYERGLEREKTTNQGIL